MLTESMIRSFLAVAETLNFTKAAEHLFLTQQAVSRNISSLENELQIKLITRDTHSVSLTVCGEIYCQKLRELTREYEDLVCGLKAQYEKQIKTLHLGIVDSPDFFHFIQLAEDYRNEFPDGLQLQIRTGPPDTLEQELLRGNLDALITLDSLMADNTDLCVDKLQKTVMKLGVSRKNRRYEAGAAWDHYANEPLILQTEAGKNIYAEDHFMHTLVNKLRIEPSAIIIMTDFGKIQHLVEEGRGIMLCTRQTSNLEENALELLDLPTGQFHYVYARKEKGMVTESQNAEQFAMYLKSRYQDE